MTEKLLATNEYALDFDGETGDYVDLSEDIVFDELDPHTVCFEFYAPPAEEEGDSFQSISNKDSGYRGAFYWRRGLEWVSFMGRDDVGDNKHSMVDLNPGEWHHVTLVFKGGTNDITWYIDGEFEMDDDIYEYGLELNKFGRRVDGDYHFNGKLKNYMVYDRELSPREIQSLYKGHLVPDGLVGHWKMNEGSGTVAKDTSGNGNHGTIHGADWELIGKRLLSKPNYSLYFDGDGRVTDIQDDIYEFSNDSDFSVSIWFMVTGNPEDGNVMGIIGRNNQWAIDYYFVGNSLRYGTRGETVYSISHTFTIDDYNKWHHAVMTHSANDEIVAYLDGEKVGDRSFDDWGPSDGIVRIADGQVIGGTGRRLIGKTDDARLYNKVISSSEIEKLYKKRYRTDVAPEHLVGHWKMNEGSGDTAYDSSGNDNHGTIEGATWVGRAGKLLLGVI